jgi:hypothetical protein
MKPDDKFHVVRDSSSGKWLVTIAIGDEYLKNWEMNFKFSWVEYADRYDLGILVVTNDLIDVSNEKWKKPTWQKLLIASNLKYFDRDIEVVCYLDTDILINPFAPDVFDQHIKGQIGVVSLRKNLPFDYEQTLRRLALLRHKFIDDKYPLDSALFIDLPGLYGFHNLPAQQDEFCAGFFLFEPIEFASDMEAWFNKYDKTVDSITNGGDQTHLNFHIQSSGVANFIPYEFQAIWAFEAANYYGHLFIDQFKDIDLFKKCVQSTLLRVNFLHFAGKWPESSTFSNFKFNFTSEFYTLYKECDEYSKVQLTGKPKGTINPNTK